MLTRIGLIANNSLLVLIFGFSFKIVVRIRFDDTAVAGMELEADVFILGPGREEDGLTCRRIFLQEHFFEADKGGATPVVIRTPVEAWTPECGKR